VLAAGGIGDGRGLMAALALGAEGVEMGTRFIATKECTMAHPKYIDYLINGNETDTTIIKKSIGAPGRVLKSPLVDEILKREDQGGGYEAIKAFVSGEANRKFIYDGDEVEGFGWAGQVIGLIKDNPTVQELFDNIEADAKNILAQWQGNLTGV